MKKLIFVALLSATAGTTWGAACGEREIIVNMATAIEDVRLVLQPSWVKIPRNSRITKALQISKTRAKRALYAALDQDQTNIAAIYATVMEIIENPIYTRWALEHYLTRLSRYGIPEEVLFNIRHTLYERVF